MPEFANCFEPNTHIPSIVILSFWTDRSEQTDQKEQSDKDLDCLSFPLHLSHTLHYGITTSFKFLGYVQQFFDYPNFFYFYSTYHLDFLSVTPQ